MIKVQADREEQSKNVESNPELVEVELGALEHQRRRKYEVYSQKASRGLSFQSIEVDSTNASAEFEWLLYPHEGSSQQEIPLSNLLHHRSAI